MEQHSKIAKWSLIIGIVIVLNLFFTYSLSFFYKAPDYTEYFSQPQIIETYTKELCISAGGQWSTTPVDLKSNDQQVKNGGYCDPEYTARIKYEGANKEYERTVFMVLAILGIVTLIIGTFIATNTVLALAFAWGGVLSLVIASIRYWSEANSLIRVFILASALGALIWTAIKKFNKS